MVVVSVTAVLATIVIHIYVRGDRRQGIPPTVRRIFLQYLARLYCMTPRASSALPRMCSSRLKSASPGALLLPEQIFLTPHYHEEEFSKKLKLLKQRFQEFHRQQQQQQQLSISEENLISSATMSALSMNLRSIENDLKEVRDYLRHMKKKVENTDRSDKNASDWKQVALILDRTFFFAYCFWFVISLIMMFPKTINISKTNWTIPNVTSIVNVTTTDIQNMTLI
jgi:hypothetical protein